MKRIAARTLTLLLALCLLISSKTASSSFAAPTITDVDPERIVNDIDYPIHITGSGFSNAGSMPQVKLGDTALINVRWEDETSLYAAVPWGMKPGEYTLTVTNPEGGQAVYDQKMTVANGMGIWNTGDLLGGPVDTLIAIKQQPGMLYAQATTSGVLFRSTDYGQHWQTAGKSLGSWLAVDPFDPMHVFENSQHSRDGGLNWTPLFPNGYWPGTNKWNTWGSHPFPHPRVKDLIFVSAGSTSIPILDEEPSGLVRSTDGGQTWQIIQTGIAPGDLHITSLAFDPVSNNELYIGTRNGQIYRSTDNGSTWVKQGAPLESIGNLWINPFRPDELWAATYNRVTTNSRLVKISRSAFNQVTDIWAGMAMHCPNMLTFIDAQTAYLASMWSNGWKTTNGGVTWEKFEPSTGMPAFALTPDPWDSTGKTFYIADYQYGVQKSVDGGLTWQISNQGMHGLSASTLVVDHKNPSRVYALMAGESWPGVFITETGGQRWQFVEPEPGQRLMYHSIAANQDRLFVVGNGAQNFVYRSTDQGKTWDEPSIIPHHPDYPTHFQHGGNLFVDPGDRHTLLVTANLGIPNTPPDLFFNEIFRSTDNGATWAPVNVTRQIGKQVKFYEIAFDPHDSNIVYASGNGVLLKSTDNGVTWKLITETGPFFGDLVIEPDPPYRLYISDWYSENGGVTWLDMPAPFHLGTLAFVPGTSIIYGGGMTGLALSTDKGKTWRPADGPLGTAGISTLTLAKPDHRYILYVSTTGGSSIAGQAQAQSANLDASTSLVESGVYRFTREIHPVYVPMIRR